MVLIKGSDLQADLACRYGIRQWLWIEKVDRAQIDSRTGGRKVLPTNACPISAGMQLIVSRQICDTLTVTVRSMDLLSDDYNCDQGI